ncbi:prenyltransferase [Acidiphilium sp.]|uniref:prenyltransferase n=1 Tax=Acidiphilium sp. TaxID=527 RepID=UPI002582EB0E|nr:prenyltransferase [Acidiphilium sp.]
MDQFGAMRLGGNAERASADQALTAQLFDKARRMVIAGAIDGNPSATPLLCARDGEDLVFAAHRASRLAALLSINPRAQAIVETDDPLFSLLLEVTGFCVELREAAARGRVLAALHGGAGPDDAAAREFACYRLRPTRLALVDRMATPRFAWQALPQNRRSDARLALEDLGGWMRLWIRTVRAPFFTAAIVPVLLGGAVARFAMARAGTGADWPWALFLWCIAGVLLAAAGTNLINDYGDHETGADEGNEVGGNPFTGGSRAIQLGMVAAWKVLLGSAICFGGTVAIGLHINAALAGHALAPTPLLGFGVIGCALGIMYTMGPFRLSYRGLGEVAVPLGFGPVIVLGTAYVLASAMHVPVPWLVGLLAALPVSVFVLLILWINQFQDAPADAAAGKRTWVVRLAETAGGDIDFRRPFRAYLALDAAGFGLIALLGLIGRADPALATRYAFLALLPLPLALVAARKGSLWVRRWRAAPGERARLPFELLGVNAITIGVHLATGLLLALAYLLAG